MDFDIAGFYSFPTTTRKAISGMTSLTPRVIQGNEMLEKLALRLLASAAVMASAAFASVAHAAGLSPPAAVNWTGFYIGGNVGYSHGRYSGSNTTATTSAGIDFGGGVLPFGSATAGLPSLGSGDSSFTGGGQIGFNYQIGQTVLGLEADFQGANLNGSFDSNGIIDLSGFPVGINSSVSLKSDWYATVRGRIGHSFGAFLPYVTGGLAITEVKAQVINSTSADLSSFGLPAFSASTSDSIRKTLIGYAIGAGLEYALGGGWSIKAEYLHLGFEDLSYDVTTPFSAPLAAGLNLSGTTAVHADVKTDFDIARVGANYRF